MASHERTPAGEEVSARTAMRSPGGGRAAVAGAPLALVLVLLVIATWFKGAFAIADWAPIAVLVLLSLAVMGATSPIGRGAMVFVLALSGFAAWSALSATWADAPGRALEGAARNALYAGLAWLSLTALIHRGAAVMAARSLVAGLGLLVLASVIAVAVDGPDAFLAGRLDDPVGYRNATAALMAMAAVALICAAAPRDSSPLVRALSMASAVMALCLGYATQSRGVALGLIAGMVVVLVLGPERLRRAWLAILAVAAVALVEHDLLAPYRGFLAGASATDADVAMVARAVLTAGAAAGILMAALAVLDGGLRLGLPVKRALRAAATAGLAAIVVAGAIVGLQKTGDPVAWLEDKADEFRVLTPQDAPPDARLGSVGGQRYDLWRIAWKDFQAAPLTGSGEGSFRTRYYLERSTDRNLSAPHSLPLRVLSENGLVGALLLVGALAVATVALLSHWRRLPDDARRWASTLAGVAAVLLVQSAVDWLWLIAGLTGIAIVCLAVAVRIATAPEKDAEAMDMRRRLPGIAGRATAALAALIVASLFISAVQVREARSHQAGQPERQLAAAERAELFNPFALTPRYLQAGALERQGRVAEARSELLSALKINPASFVTLTLLGDLEARAGDVAAARGWYRRALARNPQDSGLRELAD